MDEIAKIALDNEMDLILAHKRSMKLAELSGLSLSAQTSFATAVSEVARTSIESGKRSYLVLGVKSDLKDDFIVASLTNQQTGENAKRGLEYAKRLVNKYQVLNNGGSTSIELYYAVPAFLKADIRKLDEWRTLFRNEPPVSPYEEIKRKNEQMQEMSERLQKSESQYKTLTNSLPLIIFSLGLEGNLLYANEWLSKFTGQTIESLNTDGWRSIVHEEDYDAFSHILKSHSARNAKVIRTQARFRNGNDADYFWHMVSITPFRDDKDELQYWIGYMVDIHAQKVYEETLKDNVELKQAQVQLELNQKMLQTYVDELNRSNKELQQFAFIASHDLQEPIRKLLFYSDYLLNQYETVLDNRGSDLLRNMHSASMRMRALIQDLLLFSHLNSKPLEFKPVDLNIIVKDALQDLEIAITEKNAQLNISSLPTVGGDAGMMRQLFENILGNSLKYSSTSRTPVINIRCTERNGQYEIVFEDNGIGFDEKYLPKVFTLFQRLHNREAYEGTGLGLAICQKIVELHQGRIWAEAREDVGASFFISLPSQLVKRSEL
ncbi:PAS domain-containing sensor histidine kinase [Flavihumibacter solisilvae]|uniref:histidine kinase n=1 Tax=Flavihumibacter solisilvae TaxID=1349421 RepID=A0A0C1LE03_9BACT|nr:ATP-binding protein [Flavihumibacter solisilvae]KIC93683.1 histidine kinase [Flavihumibacter solisilvae]